MEDARRRHQLMRLYRDEVHTDDAEGEAGAEEEEEGEAGAGPSSASQDMDGFKRDVREWMDLDTMIKSLQSMLKERRTHKKTLVERIVRFMNEHDIEDLDTREGSIRSRVSYVKQPLSQRLIRESLNSYFSHNEAVAAQVMNTVFNQNRDRIEKMSLKLQLPKCGGV